MAYTGEKNKKGLMHGKGILRFSDGSVYEGGWANGKKVRLIHLLAVSF